MTEELKEKLKQAKTEEEAKEIIENHKDELDEKDLAAVTGGGHGKATYNIGLLCQW